ncbi:MAG TPA: hypothetical protein VHL58_20720 [Thermoanaerobaculia bacterium]|nr:hypothetical protein [Thermoanaerobaculia bacterium]
MVDPDFEYFTGEYSSAVEAFKNLKGKAGAILLMGGADELGGFLEQFITMATERAREASEKQLDHFEEWFQELATQARELRRSVSVSGGV